MNPFQIKKDTNCLFRHYHFWQILFIAFYIRENKVMAVVGGYFLFSSILKAATGIDCCLPCLWRMMTGIQCPGCGLTTAFIALLKLDIQVAMQSNTLILVLIPALIGFLVADWKRSLQRFKKERIQLSQY